MNNHELLQKKLHQQKHRRFLQFLTGIHVLCGECMDSRLSGILHDLHSAGYFSEEKQPDDKIPSCTEKTEFYRWIVQKMELTQDSQCYLLHENIWSAIQITDPFSAVQGLWEKTNGFALLNTGMDTLYEISNDSRDEQHYLFDTYYFEKRPHPQKGDPDESLT